MPARSLNSSVFKWPDAQEVDRAVRAWASVVARRHTNVVRIGYFGSYARGDWGVGSDLDLLAIVEGSEEPFERRSLSWDLRDLPVAADLLVYTVDEWEKLQAEGGRFVRTLEQEAVWLQ
ncbi:MAG: nucleotidyltransferase domain-containing protein [Desulfomonile sp.]|nr:nucleotidyltransferase domain-containing protein [Deltaproteobacteria bacterium]